MNSLFFCGENAWLNAPFTLLIGVRGQANDDENVSNARGTFARVHARTRLYARTWPSGLHVAVVTCMKSSLCTMLLSMTLLTTGVTGALVIGGEMKAEAADADTIAVGEVSQPPASAGVDASLIRSTAEGEIRLLDASRVSRRVVVSLAMTKAGVDGPYACTMHAMLRDARTGVMIAIIEAGAQAEGPASLELRKQVANAAVRSVVRRIPKALGAK